MKVRKDTFRNVWLIAVVTMFSSCTDKSGTISNKADLDKDDSVEKLNKQKDAIVPFFSPMKIERGDWLDTQNEPGETFEQYIVSNPTLPTKERNTIYRSGNLPKNRIA